MPCTLTGGKALDRAGSVATDGCLLNARVMKLPSLLLFSGVAVDEEVAGFTSGFASITGFLPGIRDFADCTSRLIFKEAPTFPVRHHCHRNQPAPASTTISTSGSTKDRPPPERGSSTGRKTPLEPAAAPRAGVRGGRLLCCGG